MVPVTGEDWLVAENTTMTPDVFSPLEAPKFPQEAKASPRASHNTFWLSMGQYLDRPSMQTGVMRVSADCNKAKHI